MPCAALLAWIAISKSWRQPQNIAEVEIPPKLMSWGMVIDGGGGGGGAGAVGKKHCCSGETSFVLSFFCSFNLNSYVERGIQVCKYIEYTKFELTL